METSMIIKRPKQSVRVDCVLPLRADGFAWVYILSAGEVRALSKIGIAVDLKIRFDRIARARDRAYPIEFHCAYQLPYAINRSVTQAVEATAHSALEWWRFGGAGDWFMISPERAEKTLVNVIRAQLGRDFPLIRCPERLT
jgi:hypothetical protein